MPKFSPAIVKLRPPVVAVFRKLDQDKVGGSKVKKTALVPITVCTVTLGDCRPVVVCTVVGPDRHCVVVADVHDVLKHAAVESV